MKKTKLKIENFLGDKLDNPMKIVGGDGEVNPLPTSGGSNTTGGNGSGEAPPNTQFGNPLRPTGPLEAPDVP